MRIADDVKAIKAGLDHITGAQPTGVHFDASGKRRESGWPSSASTFSRFLRGPVRKIGGIASPHESRQEPDWYTRCGRCRFTREDADDGLVGEACPGTPSEAQKISNYAYIELWLHPDGSKYNRDMRRSVHGRDQEYAEACFQAWRTGGAGAAMPPPTRYGWTIVTEDEISAAARQSIYEQLQKARAEFCGMPSILR